MGNMRPISKWEAMVTANPDHSHWFVQRFRDMAQRGEDIYGEARLIDAIVPRGARILDAGCGSGRVGGHLVGLGHTVVGVDVDPVLIEAARDDHPQGTWVLGDLVDLDLPREGVTDPFEARLAVLDGSDPEDEWVVEDGARSPGLIPADRLPQLERTDYVANGNDPHWLTNPDHLLTGYSPLHGLEAMPSSLRTRQNVRTVARLAAAGDATVESVIEAVLNNESLSAELLRDEVQPRCGRLGAHVHSAADRDGADGRQGDQRRRAPRDRRRPSDRARHPRLRSRMTSGCGCGANHIVVYSPSAA